MPEPLQGADPRMQFGSEFIKYGCTEAYYLNDIRSQRGAPDAKLLEKWESGFELGESDFQGWERRIGIKNPKYRATIEPTTNAPYRVVAIHETSENESLRMGNALVDDFAPDLKQLIKNTDLATAKISKEGLFDQKIVVIEFNIKDAGSNQVYRIVYTFADPSSLCLSSEIFEGEKRISKTSIDYETSSDQVRPVRIEKLDDRNYIKNVRLIRNFQYDCLDKESCYLAAYGLPEPIISTPTSTYGIWFILIGAILCVSGYIWNIMRKSR